MSLVVSCAQCSHQPWGLDCTSGLARIIPCFPSPCWWDSGANETMTLAPYTVCEQLFHHLWLPCCWLAQWPGWKILVFQKRPNCTQTDKLVWGRAHWARLSPAGDMGTASTACQSFKAQTGLSEGQGFVRFPALHSGPIWAQWHTVLSLWICFSISSFNTSGSSGALFFISLVQ